ncbi:MAG: glycosyltransferase family 39 protein [Lachnospiraceae bacterium]|nr:glycosyltransferase family 39 protein [Lachnospiraceae bacterium]
MENKSFTIKPFILLFTLILVISFCFDMTEETLLNPAYLFAFISALIVLITFRKNIKKDEMTLIYAVMIAGILIKTVYIFYTAVYTRQHDVIDFGAAEGHGAYIEYILLNRSLPKGDPREKWAFFQPPLHHIIAAVWMKICGRFLNAYRRICENVQALTLFYTSVTEIISLFICKELKLRSKGILTAMLVISLHPVYIIMSGSVNNDALSLMLSVITIYLAILWYKNSTLPRIILLAFSLGLAMFAKLSGGMTAVPLAFIFLIKLIRLVREKGSWFKLILQYAVFAVIVFPLGIGWEVRNMLLYKMPFNYIPPVGEQFENISLLSRFADLGTDSIYPSMIRYGSTHDEYNVLLLLFKTAVFDEYDLSRITPYVNPFAAVLLITSVLLAFIALIATVCESVKNIRELRSGLGSGPESGLTAKASSPETENEEGCDPVLRLMPVIWYITMLIAYFSFTLSYDNFSAGSFRYVAAIIVCEGILLGAFHERMENKKVSGALSILLYLFAGSSLIVYTTIGFFPQI